MPRPHLPRRTYYRAAALRGGLDPIIAELDTLPDRRAPLAPPLRSRGWEAVAAARRGLGLPPLPPSTPREKPADLVVEIVAVFHRLTTLKPLQTKLTPGLRHKTYPRASERV